MSEVEQPEYVIGHIQEALASRTGELELDVRIVKGCVYVSGSVTSPDRVRAVEDVVREVAGELDVCNELSVVADTEPGPEEALR